MLVLQDQEWLGQGGGVPKAGAQQAAADSRGSRTCVCANTFGLGVAHAGCEGRIDILPWYRLVGVAIHIHAYTHIDTDTQIHRYTYTHFGVICSSRKQNESEDIQERRGKIEVYDLWYYDFWCTWCTGDQDRWLFGPLPVCTTSLEFVTSFFSL